MARKKTAIEHFLSFNWHRKRFGARRLAKSPKNLASLKTTLVLGDEAIQTRGSEKTLERHLHNLRNEFVGQSELVFHHAKLIVLIRREYRTRQTFGEFKELWNEHADFLCQHLNIRWLISACDTFADHDPDFAISNLALATSMFVNTIKIYESERFITDTQGSVVQEDRVQLLQTELVPLFEGLSCFTVGTDDTLRNMRWRLDRAFASHPVGLILKTIYDRIQTNDTAFRRFKSQHRRDRTSWW